MNEAMKHMCCVAPKRFQFVFHHFLWYIDFTPHMLSFSLNLPFLLPISSNPIISLKLGYIVWGYDLICWVQFYQFHFITFAVLTIIICLNIFYIWNHKLLHYIINYISFYKSLALVWPIFLEVSGSIILCSWCVQKNYLSFCIKLWNVLTTFI